MQIIFEDHLMKGKCSSWKQQENKLIGTKIIARILSICDIPKGGGGKNWSEIQERVNISLLQVVELEFTLRAWRSGLATSPCLE